MFDAEEVFVANVDELRRLVANPTNVNLLNSSKFLRALLFDKHPILSLANRKHGVKIVFEVVDVPELPPFLKENLVFRSFGSFYPGDERPGRLGIRKLNLDQFLRTVRSHYGKSAVTVRELISYIAHHAGGVHLGPPNSAVDRDIESIGKKLNVQDNRAPLNDLIGVIRVILDAVAPLYDEIKRCHPAFQHIS